MDDYFDDDLDYGFDDEPYFMEDDDYAFMSAGHGTDESYGFYGEDGDW